MRKNYGAHMAAAGSAETFSALPRTEGAAHTQLSQQTKRHSALKALPSSPAALRSAHADGLSAPLADVAVLYRSMLCTDPVGQSSKMISRGKKAAVNKQS